MTPERWHQITSLFQQAVARPPENRQAWLERACGADIELRSHVETLLKGDAGTFLDDARLTAAFDSSESLGRGTRLGPYEIEHLIASGGMGEVYAARDTRLGRAVAVKVLPDVFQNDPRRRRRFEREARVISSLTHPHICTLHDVGEHDGHMYLVMERLEGITLAERIAQGPLPIPDILDLSVQMAGALDQAHRLGIIHGDVKPANVILTDHGAKLLDFGVARGVGAAIEESTALTTSRTADDSVVAGTPGYMAPEQFNGAPADARTDVFAFGVVLVEMLTGARARDDMPAIRNVRPETPTALERLAAHCLESDVARRCPNAAHLLAELRLIDAPALRRGTRRRRFRALLRTRVLAPLAAVAGVLLWALGPFSKTEDASARQPTVPGEAYSAYVRALEYLNSDAERDQLAAIALLQQSTQLAPEFVDAQAKLAYAHGWIWWQGYDRSPARKAEAKEAIDRALAIEPDSPEVRKALGFYYYWCELDFERGEQELRRARAARPDDPETLLGISSVLRRQGRLQDALPPSLELVRMVPRNALYWENLALTYALLRRPSDADNAMARATEANPLLAMAHAARAHWLLRLVGDVGKAREVLASATRLALGDDNHVAYASVLTDIHARAFVPALRNLAASAHDAFQYQPWYVPKDLLEAQILGYLGRRAAAGAAFRRAAAHLESRVQARPDDARYHSALGLAYAGLGRKADAIREGELAVRLEPVKRDVLRGPYRIEDLARIYAIVGEADAAIDRLEYLMSIPHDVAAPGLRLDPAWDPLRRQPRFHRLLAR